MTTTPAPSSTTARDADVASAFESAVNRVVAKRFLKKQQMRWTPRGAHLLLQVRVTSWTMCSARRLGSGIRALAWSTGRTRSVVHPFWMLCSFRGPYAQNLWQMRLFYTAWSADQIPRTLSGLTL